MSRQVSWHSQKYHDFPKLRELHRARMNASFGGTSLVSTASWNTLSRPSWQPPQLQQQQRRPFVTDLWRDLQLKRLEFQANSAPEDTNVQQQFVSELLVHHPEAAAARLTHPEFQHFAVNREMIVEYLQYLQHTAPNQVKASTMEALLQKLAHHRPSDAALPLQWKELVQHHKWNSKDQLAHLIQFLTTGAAGGAANATAATAPALLRGLDSKSPIYVQIAQPGNTARGAVLGFVARAALLLITISAVGALLDDRMGGRPGGPQFGMNSNSKHVQESQGTGNIRFHHVKGVTEAKQELEEIVLYLKDPSKFTRLGGKLPRGLLLTGPPGTGKTMLAKAIAGEAGVPFFFSSGSQFEEVYVGLGAKRIRELFEAAKKKAPAIVFIDEIDAVGGTRRLKDQSALKMTLNELLVQLDGFEENNGVIVIGATNFMESLDQALLRPGRFDKHVTVPLPDVGGRKEILEMYAEKTKLAPDVDLSVLARGTTGMSGADLYNLMNQAALKASVDGLPHITVEVLEYAKDKILMGAERRSAVISKETAKCTAYHEAGHALVAVLTEGAMPIHKATIISRGSALGMVTMLPEGDQTSQSYKEMVAYMDVAMGGRVAEELTFGKENVTSGASSDIQHATRIARNMVTKYGFSDQVGFVFHGGSTGEESASAETRTRIDAEVQKLTTNAYNRAKELLTKHTKEHKLLAETLLEYETLTGDEVRELVKKRRKPKRSPMVDPKNNESDDSSSGGGKSPSKASGSSSSSSSSSGTNSGGIRGRLFGKEGAADP